MPHPYLYQARQQERRPYCRRSEGKLTIKRLCPGNAEPQLGESPMTRQAGAWRSREGRRTAEPG